MIDSGPNRKTCLRARQVQYHFIPETAHALFWAPMKDPGSYIKGQLTMSQGRQRYLE